jgi:hypothetical protein
VGCVGGVNSIVAAHRAGCYALRVDSVRSPRRLSDLIPPLALIALGVAAVAYLLARHPYDGMYGQDTYGYYGQALAWWREMRGDPQPEFAFYSSQAFRWPVGYHLHIILGFLLGGAGTWGGWVLNMAMVVMCPVLVYVLVHGLFPVLPRATRVGAGIIAGGLLMVSGTYLRFGLSLMADVPTLFWGLLGYNAALRVWSPSGAPKPERAVWALAAGVALGLAVLNRYGALLLLPPLFPYMLLRWNVNERKRPLAPTLRAAGIVLAGFVIALLPQALYLATHQAGAGYSAFIDDWSPANIFASTLSSTDGTLSYGMPMLAFFLLVPLVSAEAGLLSFYLLPAFIAGLAYLAKSKAWPALAFLLTWWLGAVLLYSGTPYQAHRFIILYLPALTIPVGFGTAYAVQSLLGAGKPTTGRVLQISAILLLLFSLVGLFHSWRWAERWMETHASFKRDEEVLLRAARSILIPGETPRVVAFGQTAAIHHYTGWPALDIYNHDREALAEFLAWGGTRLIVVPEESLRTQWAETPTGERWEWLQASYPLTRQGRAGQYSVYLVGP